MKRYEYKILSNNVGENELLKFEQILNDMGQDGWQLVCSYNQDVYSNAVLVFMREVGAWR